MNKLELPDPIEGIAVVGLAGRFPKARNIAEFWQNLRDGVEAVTFFYDEELAAAGISPNDLNHPNYVKARAILEDAEWFDAPFFGINPREAEVIDPQQRIFLECAWEAMEDAGYTRETFPGSIAVYAGATMNTYLFNNLATNPNLVELIGPYQLMICNNAEYMPTRVSYKLNLNGPSLNIQTACSTSLVTIVMACQSLLSYQCDMALAGGVSVMFPQKKGHFYQEGGIYSPDGHCRAFDHKGQGTVGGQGVGVVVLKRLEDSLADGDQVYAIIKGAAVNNDGSAKVGYTAPSINGQAEVISLALALARVEANTISYVETHGMATPLGDPIEIAGLTQAFRATTEEKGFCALGSVKTNIGHLDAAAGVASFIKTVLALKHKELPPSLHYEQPNPTIDFASSPFYVNNTLTEWPAGNTPRRAGVNSFGIGGTNAHVVLEEAPGTLSGKSPRNWHLLTLSAKTDTALQKATENLAEHIQKHPNLNLADVAYTLQIGRKAFNHRRIVVCSDLADAVEALKRRQEGQVFTQQVDTGSKTLPVVFAFTDQSMPVVNMGFELYQAEATFQEQVDLCAKTLKPHLGLDLRDVLYPGSQGFASEAQVVTAVKKLQQTDVAQTALFTIEYAMAQLWLAWGVRPQAMLGHGIGEYVAACLADVLSREDACVLAAKRGQLLQKLSSDATFTSPPHAHPGFAGNEKAFNVVSAPVEAVANGVQNQQSESRPLWPLSPVQPELVTSIKALFKAQFNGVSLKPPRIPFVSSLSGYWIAAAEATDPDYWCSQLFPAKRINGNLQELLKDSRWILLEVGPGNLWTGRESSESTSQMVLSSLPNSHKPHSEAAFLLTTLGRWWLEGTPVNWPGLYANEQRHRVSLPTYPFERQRYWIEPQKSLHEIRGELPAHTGSASRYSRPGSMNAYVAPRNELEQQVADLWEELLGIEPVGIQDNFFDLGGSSMLALRLFAELEKRHGKKYPLAILLEASTVEELAQILSDKNRKIFSSSLVPIQSIGSRPPFICVHAAGGNVLFYRELANYLGPDQPFYGLQSQGLDGTQPPLTTVEDMAALYVKEIKTFQPEGPYYLGGYCLGGTIALEMAQQLKAEGQEVAFLGLFETYNWKNIVPDGFFRSLTSYLLQKASFNLHNWWQLDFEGKKTFLTEKMKVVMQRGKIWYGLVRSKFDGGYYERIGSQLRPGQLWEINDQASLRYNPTTYSGRITHFIPRQEYTRHQGTELSWDNLATEVETYILPNFPGGMFVEPYVEQTAEVLNKCLEATQATIQTPVFYRSLVED